MDLYCGVSYNAVQVVAAALANVVATAGARAAAEHSTYKELQQRNPLLPPTPLCVEGGYGSVPRTHARQASRTMFEWGMFTDLLRS